MSWRTQPRDRRGRWTRRSGLGLVVAGVALAVGLGGFGAGTGDLAGSGGTSAGRPAAGAQGGGARIKARARSTTRAVQHLRSRGLRVDTQGVHADDDCAEHAYGEVRDVLVAHPCSALYRALFRVHDGRVTAMVAVAWVDLPDDGQAIDFQQLVDRGGTGNITELTKEGYPPTSMRWTGTHYTSVRSGGTVVNAQAEPVGPTAEAIRLAGQVAGAAVE